MSFMKGGAAVAIVAVLLLSVMVLFIYSDGQKSAPTLDERDFSFIVYRDGSEIRCLNASSGEVSFSSPDGSDAIQYALASLPQGGKVLVRAGDYLLTHTVEMANDTELRGVGPDTVLMGQTSVSLLIEGRSNITVGWFTLRGSGNILVAGINAPVSDVHIEEITATIDSLPEGVFYLLSLSEVVSNISFVRCTALNCGTTGFMNNGNLDRGWVENISYQQCRAIGCGLKERYNDWVVGFDLAELVNVRGMSLQDCDSSNNWQSGFHFEMVSTVNNAVLRSCSSNDNGRAKGAPDGTGAGWGFTIYKDAPRHDIRLYSCSASNNWHGDTNLGTLVQVQG